MNIKDYVHRVEGQYRKYFKNALISFDEMIDVELILLGFHRLTQEYDPYEAWTIVTGYPVWNKKALSPTQKRMVEFLHIRYQQSYGNSFTWKQLLDQYFEVDSSYRLFLYDKEKNVIRLTRPKFDLYRPHEIKQLVKRLKGNVRTQTTQRFVNVPTDGSIKNLRLVAYYHILKAWPNSKPASNHIYLETGKYHYKGTVASNEFWFMYETDTPETVPLFPAFREKKRFVRDEATFDRESVGAEMGPKWAIQSKRSKMVKNKKTQNKLVYGGQLSLIAGGVGVGKNAFIEEELYRLFVKEKSDARVMVVVRTNQAALDVHHSLRELGMNATFVPGIYSKQKHEEDYLERLLKEGETFNSLLDKARTLDAVDSDCLFKIYHDVETEEGTLPCMPFNRFSKEEDGQMKPAPCPYFNQCGIVRPFLEMQQANILITTPYALSKSSVPSFLDAEKRSLQQIVHDLVDVVFFDEVDEVMSIYDAESVQETKITGGLEALHPVMQLGSRRTMFERSYLYTNQYVTKWMEGIQHTDMALSMLHQLLEHHLILSDIFKNKVMNIFQLGHRFLDYLLFANEEDERFYRQKFVTSFIYSTDDDSIPKDASGRAIRQIRETFRQLVNNNYDRTSKKETIHRLFEQLNWKVNPRTKGRYSKENDSTYRAELVFEMLAYLYHFETHFRQMVALYPMVKNVLNLEDRNMNYVLGVRNKLFPLLKATPTGARFGYRLQRLGNKQELSLLRYNGETRHLLTDWHNAFHFFDMKRDEDGNIRRMEGPTLLGLSGTAYIPHSPHFHFQSQDVYKLKNRQTAPTITCYRHFIPTMEEKADYLYVSGTNSEERKHNLREMTLQSLPAFEQQLKHWARQGENRKILITPSSYEDAKTVASVLASKLEWRSRFAFLSRDHNLGDLQPYAIRPSDVETEVHKREIDILVAPLLVISRGYNILLPGTPKSYFGSMFLFARPYYLVDDMLNLYKLMHKDVNRSLMTINKNGAFYGDYMSELRRRSQSYLFRLLTKPYYTSGLEKEEMEDLSLYAFTLVAQTLGRLLRGDTDAHLIIVDAKMHYHSLAFQERMEKMNKETSMLNVWSDYLERHSKNEIFQDCFGSLIKGLQTIKEL